MSRFYWYVYGTLESKEEELVYKFPKAVCDLEEVEQASKELGEGGEYTNIRIREVEE